MLLPEQVKTLIEGVTPCEHVEVEGDGHHFFAVIVSSSFEGKARLARHLTPGTLPASRERMIR